MNDINLAQQSEADIELSFTETDEENYENYRSQSLPEGYTPYRENIQAGEAVYDRYDSAYAGNESEQEPKTCFRNRSRCKIGWLLHLSKIIHGLWRFHGFSISCTVGSHR